MALSSSGAISFSQIQTEFGGSNPISLSEYYSGSLPSNTGSTTVITPSVTSHSATYTAGSGKSTYTAYQYTDGWANSNLGGIAANVASNTTESITINEYSGVDLTGNSGAIPSSGTIDMNKFRGTSAGTNNSFTLLGVVYWRDTGSVLPNILYMYISGHVGTAVTYPNTPTTFGLPCVSLSCAAEGNAPATVLYNAAQSSTNGLYNSHNGLTHQNNSSLGNYSICSMIGLQTNSQVGGFSGTWTITVNH